ncbi:MAG TPA: oxalate/formate MFS antiporter [Gemmatimonadaceae bacterium]|nr:oxalate/formate MFS antiporter [Gemmatimonadaceae bacterium]
MPAPAAILPDDKRAPTLERWWQLIVGIVCMSMIANLQYGWTLFVNPIDDKFHWGRPAIQVAFTVFVLTETALVPVEGYLVDRFGPRLVAVVAGIFVALSWMLNSVAHSLPMLYAAAVVGGIGAGGVYGCCVGNALKWFPDRRGLAAGLTAMGFGAGSALTVFPIAAMIKAEGYQATFFKFGLAQGGIVFVLGWFLAAPPAGFSAPSPARARRSVAVREQAPLAMVRTLPFWVMYVMFVLVATGGLIATAQLTPIAKDFGIADAPVGLFAITLPALTFALSFDRVLNGLSRPFFGWVSDHLGRENTMCVAFVLEGLCIALLAELGRNPAAFVVMSALVFFAYGEIYSLFPATCADAYGRTYASANAGLLYTAKGVASLLVPLSSVIAASSGWHAVFRLAAGMNIAAAVLALVALKPLRARLTTTASS